MKTILQVTLMAGTAVSLLAQDPAKQDLRRLEELRQQLDQAAHQASTKVGTFEFITGGLVSGATVKGAPYSAEAVTETTQTLADGNRIVQKTSSKQYRDSEGRERQEETSSMGAIFINDPVAKASYTLHPDTRTAERGSPAVFLHQDGGDQVFFYSNLGTGYAVRQPEQTPLRAIVTQGRATRMEIGGTGAVGGAIRVNRSDAAADPNVKEEQLSPMQMEGIIAQGTRTTTTIPAGQIGNDRPINVVYERWYSPDLQMTVMTKLSDPRSGETVFKLTNIVRVEQSRSLFEIPSDYTVSSGTIRLRTPVQ